MDSRSNGWSSTTSAVKRCAVAGPTPSVDPAVACIAVTSAPLVPSVIPSCLPWHWLCAVTPRSPGTRRAADIPRDSLPCSVLRTLLPSGYSGGKLHNIRRCRGILGQDQILCRLIHLDPRGWSRNGRVGSMRNRLVRGLVFLAVILGVAIGAAGAAGAADLGRAVSADG